MTKTIKICLFLLVSASLFGQSNWESMNPYPSRYDCYDIEFVTPDTGYLINKHEIIYTYDGGSTWVFKEEIISSYDIDFYNDVGFIVGADSYILRTFNKGVNWDYLYLNTDRTFNTVNVLHEDTIIITGGDRLVTSHDGGNNWTIQNLDGILSNKSFFINANVGYIADYYGKLLKTLDGGASWYLTDTAENVGIQALNVYFVNSSIGYASYEDGRLVKSVNGGESWFELGNPGDQIYSYHFFNENVGYIGGNNESIYKTTDGGLSWSENMYNGGYGIFKSIVFIDDNIGYSVGSKGLIINTQNGGEDWTSNTGPSLDIQDIVFASESVGYLFGDDFYKSTDGGFTWDTVSVVVSGTNYEHYKYISGYFFSDNEFFIIAEDNATEILYSNNGGSTFHYIGVSSNFDYATSIFFIDQNTGYIGCHGGYGLYKTVNSGNSWTQICYDIEVDDIWFPNEQVGFCISGKEFKGTYDGGITWQVIFEYSGAGYFNDIHFINNQVGYLVGDRGRVCKTYDGGQSWEEIHYGGTNYDRVTFISEDTGYITAGNKVGKTTDGGYSWNTEELPDFLYGSDFTSITYSDPSYVFVAGEDGIIIRKQVDFTTDLIDVPNKVDINSILYPNPAENNLSVNLIDRIRMSTIYDCQGAIVYFSTENINTIDISNLTPGLYFCLIQTNTHNYLQKLIKK